MKREGPLGASLAECVTSTQLFVLSKHETASNKKHKSAKRGPCSKGLFTLPNVPSMLPLTSSKRRKTCVLSDQKPEKASKSSLLGNLTRGNRRSHGSFALFFKEIGEKKKSENRAFLEHYCCKTISVQDGLTLVGRLGTDMPE